MSRDSSSWARLRGPRTRRILTSIGPPAAIGCIAWIAAVLAPGHSALVDPAFYVTAAQIIPVVYLAIVLERRVFPEVRVADGEPPGGGSSLVIVFTLVGVVGEIA